MDVEDPLILLFIYYHETGYIHTQEMGAHNHQPLIVVELAIGQDPRKLQFIRILNI